MAAIDPASTSHVANSFLYLRKSRDRRDEREDPDVLRRHRAILLEVIAKDGQELREERIFEEVRSGESITRRPEFSRLLTLLGGLPLSPKDRVGGLLYCMDADRLSRGMLKEQGEIQELLISRGIVIRTPSETVDLRHRVQRLMHTVKGALAEYELAQGKDRMERVRGQMVKEGKSRTGSVPFGYRWDYQHKRPAPDPVDFPVLQALCREAFTLSTHQLSKKYGVCQQQVWTALTSPTICGYPAKTTGYRPGTKSVIYLPREEWEWPVVQAGYPTAMERGEWERLQQVIAGRRVGKGVRDGAPNAWCRDVVWIAGCDKRPRLSVHTGSRGTTPTYERGKLYVARQAVHEAVAARLAALDWGRLLTRLEGWQAPSEPSADLTALEAEQQRLTRKLAAVNDALTDPDATDEDRAALKALRAQVNAALSSSRKKLDALRSHAPSLSRLEVEALAVAAEQLGRDFTGMWNEGMTDEERRLVVRTLVAEALVTIEVAEPRGRHRRTVAVRLRAQLEEA